jgi:hypothetical protein
MFWEVGSQVELVLPEASVGVRSWGVEPQEGARGVGAVVKSSGVGSPDDEMGDGSDHFGLLVAVRREMEVAVAVQSWGVAAVVHFSEAGAGDHSLAVAVGGHSSGVDSSGVAVGDCSSEAEAEDRSWAAAVGDHFWAAAAEGCSEEVVERDG